MNITKTHISMASKSKKTNTQPISTGVTYLPTKDFPYLERYKAQFSINEDEVAFPYKGVIYTNLKELPDELINHERVHFIQQEEIGADVWVERYLTDPNFRAKVEIEAYLIQIKPFKNNKDLYDMMRAQVAKMLSSPMYGCVLTYKEAYGLLK